VARRRSDRGAQGRSAGLRGRPVGDRSCDFGRLGARPGAEVVVAQSVGVALQREDLGVVDESVDHRDGGHSSPKISPQAENGLLLATISEARS
jgi:hypothetical protein